MTQLSGEGEGMAQVIAFPLHRVSRPDEDTDTQAPGDGGAGVAGREHPVADVSTLRAKITDIETRPTPSEAFSSASVGSDKDQRRAKNIALHQLGVSGRSEAEVRERLAARDIAADVIDQEVTRLIEVGLIDDAALATDLVESMRRKKKLGNTAISHALRRRKIPQNIIEQALTDSEFDSDEAIFELAAERARALAHHDHDVAYRRLVGFIQRRGYGGPQVFDAARRALDAVAGDS